MGWKEGGDILRPVSKLLFSILMQSSGGNGIQNWTQRPMPTDHWRGVAYGNGTFVAVGYNTSATSTDNGATWTQRSIPAGDWYGVAYGNGAFVAVSYNNNTSATSTDNGATWTQRSMPTGDWHWVANAFTGTQTAPKVVATFVDKLLTVTPNAGNSNTVTIDTDLNTSFIVDNTSSTGNITIAFAGKAGVTTGNNEMGAVIVRVRQGSTARSITWPTLNAWLTSDGLSPTAPAANKQADFVFSYDTNVNGWVGRKGATS